MAWLNNPPFSLNEAQQRGVDVYEVLVSDWGRNQLSPEIINLQWPPAGQQALNISLAGMAIGPRSTVDRCWVSYNLQKHQLTTGLETTDRMRRLSVDSPLIFTQAAAKDLTPDFEDGPPYQQQAETGPLIVTAYSGIFNQPENFGGGLYPPFTVANAGYIPVDSTVMPLEYRDVNGRDRAFITDVEDPSPGALFPLLHLYLYVKQPPTYVPPKRFPLILRGQLEVDNSNEVIIAQIPTYGRKQINVMLRGLPSVTGTYDFRIGALRALADNRTAGYGSLCHEEPVDSITGVAPDVPVVLSSCAGRDLNADYLNVYATRVGTDEVRVVMQFTAYD